MEPEELLLGVLIGEDENNTDEFQVPEEEDLFYEPYPGEESL